MRLVISLMCAVFGQITIINMSLADGSINVVAKNHDGWAEGRATLYRVTTEEGVEKQERAYSPDLQEGKARFSVSPGRYFVRVSYGEARKSPVQASDIFEVADEQAVRHDFYFENGSINIVVKDHDGWAKGRATLYRVTTEEGVEKSGGRDLPGPARRQSAVLCIAGTIPNCRQTCEFKSLRIYPRYLLHTDR